MIVWAGHVDRRGSKVVNLSAGVRCCRPCGFLGAIAVLARTSGCRSLRSPWRSPASTRARAIFWTIPPRFLTGMAAAGGLAFINSIGTTGGFVGPDHHGVADRPDRVVLGRPDGAERVPAGGGHAGVVGCARSRRSEDAWRDTAVTDGALAGARRRLGLEHDLRGPARGRGRRPRSCGFSTCSAWRWPGSARRSAGSVRRATRVDVAGRAEPRVGQRRPRGGWRGRVRQRRVRAGARVRRHAQRVDRAHEQPGGRGGARARRDARRSPGAT